MPRAPRLASIDARADDWFDPACHDRVQRWRLQLPDAAALRQYLAETLDTTLELLAGADDSDAGLYAYRLALLHEDRLGEALAVCAQALQLATPAAESPWPPRPARAPREPLWFGAQRFMLGSERGGLVPPNERWAHEVQLLEFEIDAQALSWARYAEFVADGGYDDAQWWTPEGWAWVQAEGRRAPRYVEQMRQAVLVQRQGQMQRVGAAQAAVHVSRHEAQAWCRWAGRRLPTEPEWELAALTGASRGFVFGDVFEWTGGSARAWPGHEGSVARLCRDARAGTLRRAARCLVDDACALQASARAPLRGAPPRRRCSAAFAAARCSLARLRSGNRPPRGFSPGVLSAASRQHRQRAS